MGQQQKTGMGKGLQLQWRDDLRRRFRRWSLHLKQNKNILINNMHYDSLIDHCFVFIITELFF